jgi:hypothetical protein
MGTSFGTILTEQPIMVKGDFGEEQIKGTIGAGKARSRSGPVSGISV